MQPLHVLAQAEPGLRVPDPPVSWYEPNTVPSGAMDDQNPDGNENLTSVAGIEFWSQPK
jgi:hypothetical protein